MILPAIFYVINGIIPESSVETLQVVNHRLKNREHHLVRPLQDFQLNNNQTFGKPNEPLRR